MPASGEHLELQKLRRKCAINVPKVSATCGYAQNSDSRTAIVPKCLSAANPQHTKNISHRYIEKAQNRPSKPSKCTSTSALAHLFSGPTRRILLSNDNLVIIPKKMLPGGVFEHRRKIK